MLLYIFKLFFSTVVATSIVNDNYSMYYIVRTLQNKTHVCEPYLCSNQVCLQYYGKLTSLLCDLCIENVDTFEQMGKSTIYYVIVLKLQNANGLSMH